MSRRAIMSTMAALVCLCSALAQVPDLTSGGLPLNTRNINLGPTGMEGWMYNNDTHPRTLLGDLNYTGQSRQILVTVVEAGSPAAVVGIQVNDVILGASGDGSALVDFTSDARKSLALAIAAAEARTTPELKLKVWRAGSTSTFTLTLQNLGAYGPNAPLADAKSDLIRENVRQSLLLQGKSGSFGLGTLALMSLDDPAHPSHAAMKAQIDAEIAALLPNAANLASMNSSEPEGESKIAWSRGHTLIVLAEYFLNYGEHPSGGVFTAIQAYVNTLTKGQSIFGTFGHQFAQFRWPDGATTPMMGGYGAINSSAVPGLYALMLAKACGVVNPALDVSLDRGLTFYGSYAGRGAIPYGEHTPASNEFSTNGKSGAAALIFDLATAKEEETKYFTKMSAASFHEYESGHTGSFFQNIWSPLGAAHGGDDAIKSYFAETSWLYDLARKWDGSFAYNHIMTHDNYANFNSSTPYVLTYALPLKRLHMTGRGRSAAGVLTATERAEAVFSANYDPTTRTKAQLIADLADWSGPVHIRAATALAGMSLTSTDMDTLHALASDLQGSSREGALFALEKIANSSSAPVLSAILSDPDPHIRRLAANALIWNPAKATQLNTILAATGAAKRPVFPMDSRDPLHHDLHSMGNLLFSMDTNPAERGILSVYPNIVLTGVDRQLLYPAIRAIASSSSGSGRSTLSAVMNALTEDDVKALGDTLVDTAFYRAPADPMFADPARKSAMDILTAYRFAEAIPVAERSIRADFTFNANRTLYGDMFTDLQQFAGTNTLVTPDPDILRLCMDYIHEHTDFSATNAAAAAQVIDAIFADRNPSAPKYLKRFDWVVTDAATLTLPASQTQLHAKVTDHAKGDLTYTWRKVYGAGNVTFLDNGTAASKDTTVTFDNTPGHYLFEVTVIDARGLSEIKETVAMTLYDSNGTLPANQSPTASPQSITVAPGTPTPITLTGTDPESSPLVFAVTSSPYYGTLSGTAPNLTYLSEVSYHTGADSFTFQVTDSFGQTSTATVSITVDPSLLVTHVHESFDYPVGALLAGNAGGTGMTGSWLDGPVSGRAWIYDASTVATPVVTSAGTYSWDGVVDNLPTHAENGAKMVGLAVGAGDSYEIHRPLAQNAGAMAGADGVLWASIAYHRASNSFAQHLGLALSTDCFTNSARSLSTSGGHGSNLGRGIGVARPFDVGSSYCAAIFDGGSALASTTAPSFGSGDFVMVLKFEFGAIDKVSAFAFREDEVIDETSFHQRAVVATAAIDESTLNRITVAAGRGDPSYDEIRVGDTFAAVVGLAESAVDVTPPMPNPMTFAVAPTANATSITMTATTASDSSGVEYYFTCTSGGGKDSSWQASPTYTDSNLKTSTTYSYTVTARDKSANQNITAPSAVASVTTPADVAVVYEPFNYAVGEVSGLNGGNGFASGWVNTSGTTTEGFVRDETTNVFFDNTTLNWNGVLNNGFATAPSVGSRYLSSDGQSTSNVDVRRALASSAGAMAGADGVLWMSAVYRLPNSSSGASINFGLTDGGNLTDRGRRTSSMTMDFIGVSGWNGSTTWNQQVNPTIIDTTTTTNSVWNQFVRTAGGVNMASTVDKIIVLKFTFGASDKVEAFWFNEDTPLASITEAAFNAGKVGSTYTTGINENNLNTLVYSQGRFDNAVDEFRIGNSFDEVIGLAGGDTSDTTPPTLASSAIVDDQGGARVTVGTVVAYDVTFSEAMNGSTINHVDFSNAGSAAVTIGTVVQIAPNVYRVGFNALTTGTLELRVNAGAVITDLAGNPLETATAIFDDTTLTVVPPNSAPVWAANPINGTNAAEDFVYSSTLASDASDADNDALGFAKVSGPAWLQVAANGSLTGTPSQADVGSNVFTVRVTDNIAPAVEATLNITVINTNDAPVAVDGSATTDEDTVVAISLVASDIDSTIQSYTVVSAPANGTLSGTAPNLTYTPNANFNGADSFTFTANDGTAASNTATVNITVNAVNDVPVASDGSATTDEDTVVAITLTASDIDSSIQSYAIVSGPANGTLSGTAPNLTYTPNNGYTGPDSFTFTASDGSLDSNEATISITVEAAPLTPGVIAWNVSDISGNVADVSTEGTLVQAHAGADLGIGDVVDGTTLSINGVTFDDGFVFDSPSHLDTIGSRAGANTSGVYRTLLQFADRQGSGTATFTFNGLTIGSTYQIQVWHSDNVSTVQENGMVLNTGGIAETPAIGNSGHVTVLREVSEGNAGQYAVGTFIAAATSQQFLAKAYGNLSSTPTAQANITINACQLRLIATGSDSTPPTLASTDIVDDRSGANLLEDNLVTYTVTFSEDMDATTVDAADFSNAGSAPVTLGTITETTPGVFSVEVTPTAAGTLQLQIAAGATLTDAMGNALETTTAIVDDTTLTVEAANVAPVASAGSATTDEDTPVAITLAASDIDSSIQGYAIVSGPTNGTLSGTAPNLTYTPDAEFSGADSFTFTANDGELDSNTATVSITVNAVNDAAVFIADPITGDAATADIAYSGTLDGSAIDSDNDTLEYAKVSGPAWLNVAIDGTLSGTPGSTDAGENVFTVSATDGIAEPVSATLNITVNPPAGVTLLAYEGFDYPVGEVSGLNGGTGFAAGWVNSNGTGSEGYVRDETTNVFFDNTTLNWDGALNSGFQTSPSTGSRYLASDAQVTSNVDVKRTLAASAGAMAGAGGVLWMSTVYRFPNGGSGAGINIGLTDGGHLTDRGRRTSSMTMDFIGVSGWNGSSAWNQQVNPTIIDSTTTSNTVWNQFVRTAGGVNMASTVDKIIVLKFTFGASDTVEAFWFDENTPLASMTEEAFNTGKVGATYAAGIDENNLNTIVYSQGRFDNAIDEIRIGSSFAVVVGQDAPENIAPVASNGSATTSEDNSVAITLVATDEDGTIQSYTVVTSPTNGTLSGTAPNLTYTPNANFSGADSFTFTANDGTVDSNTATVSITVNAVNDAPVANAGSATTSEDTAVAVTLVATDIDSTIQSYTLVSGPTQGVLSGMAPNLTYTPNANTNGADSFTFRASDGGLNSNTATVSITVNAVNDAPVANAGSATTNEDTAVAVTLVATDIDSTIQSYTVLSGPTQGVLSGTAPNLTYTPNANSNGADSFTFRASDGGLNSNTATVSLTVNAVNDAPVWTSSPVIASGAEEGLAYTGQTLAGAATDADVGDGIIYTKVSGPAWLVVAADGALSGTPPTGTAGLNSFVVRATDSVSAFSDATLEITVAGLPLPWLSTDIGTGMLAGSATHNAGTFTQAGSGVIGGTSDRLRFTYQTLSGDGEIIARISNLQNTGTSSRVGVMIRETLANNSKQIFMGMSGTGTYRWMRRSTSGGSVSSSTNGTGTVPDTWVRIVRSGTTISSYKSSNGTSWTLVDSSTNTTFAATCYIGLAVGSGSTTTLNTSQFNNISVTP